MITTEPSSPLISFLITFPETRGQVVTIFFSLSLLLIKRRPFGLRVRRIGTRRRRYLPAEASSPRISQMLWPYPLADLVDS